MVLKIAVDAVGADKVEAVMMPSQFTSDMSKTDAAELASRLGERSKRGVQRIWQRLDRREPSGPH